MKKLTTDSFWSRLWGWATARHLGRRVNRIDYLCAQFMPMAALCLWVLICAPLAYLSEDAFMTTYLIGCIALLPALFTWGIKSGIGRLHDCNCSGWWLLLVGILTHFLYIPGLLLFFWPGTKGANSYGETPAQIKDEAREKGEEIK